MDRRKAIKTMGLGALFGSAGISGGAQTISAAQYNQNTNGIPPAKITKVKAIPTCPHGIELIVVKVETDQPGLYGVGCATFRQRAHAVVAAVDEYLDDFCRGKDVDNIEDMWQTAYVSSYWRNGPVLNNALSGLDQALRMARFSKTALLLAERFWPGPLTLVAPATSQVPSHLRNELEEIALRSPADPISQGILELAARPLVSTSANLGGGAHAHSVCDVPASVRAHCGLVLDGGEISAERLPSTVARAGPEGLEILREGALPSTDLKGRAPERFRD